jgi:hypothetical protein
MPYVNGKKYAYTKKGKAAAKKAKEKYEEKIKLLKDDIAFKDRMIKELRPKPKIRKVKKDEN